MCYAYAAGNDGCEYVVARYDPPGKRSPAGQTFLQIRKESGHRIKHFENPDKNRTITGPELCCPFYYVWKWSDIQNTNEKH